MNYFEIPTSNTLTDEEHPCQIPAAAPQTILSKPGVVVPHFLPAYRGKEIDDVTSEANAEPIFTRAENRLHAQKAILNWTVS